ncbi:phosphoribosyl-ATP diphosphatase [Phreatobacter sp. AB_2022a]|uniref:phosphoribosyl-ATP diphosphatase n=1 Tax=Phreatobacter sp. AB_2022a TaxID=3003134 RepID=UPI00228768F2|nr:phosphoribosyl-ATP diphosphatase [Phreatobacter sp. AB_2022a]MCZ0737179.1 phosphoribosyl-ATP diphosphatase [Phreatobacter sp. AB_2022a]
MSDVVERLHKAVLKARQTDPGQSRTARLIQGGRSKMAKKLVEEAAEVTIDAVCGDREAVVRESADLLYNLTVLWVDMGIDPGDVWAEMTRREQLYGIAEKLHKGPAALVDGALRRTGNE